MTDVVFLELIMSKLTRFSTLPCHKWKIVDPLYSLQSAWSSLQMSNSVHSVNSEISVQRMVSVNQPQFENQSVQRQFSYAVLCSKAITPVWLEQAI